MWSHWINLHLYNLSNVAYICLCYLPLPLKCQAKVLLSVCGVKYLMGLIIEHGLNHLVGNNWIFARVPAHRQIVTNWMNKDFVHLTQVCYNMNNKNIQLCLMKIYRNLNLQNIWNFCKIISLISNDWEDSRHIMWPHWN